MVYIKILILTKNNSVHKYRSPLRHKDGCIVSLELVPFKRATSCSPSLCSGSCDQLCLKQNKRHFESLRLRCFDFYPHSLRHLEQRCFYSRYAQWEITLWDVVISQFQQQEVAQVHNSLCSKHKPSSNVINIQTFHFRH